MNNIEYLKLLRENADRKSALQALANEAKIKKINESKQEAYKIREILENFENIKNQKIAYRENIKKSFLHEYFSILMENSMSSFMFKEYKYLIHNIVESYINEKGVDKILYSFNEKTLFLDESKKKLDTYVKIMNKTNSLDDEPVPQDDDNIDLGKDVNDVDDSMDFEFVSKFKDDINTLQFKDTGDFIKNRVNKAVEDFLTTNAANKEKIKDIIDKTQDKMNKIENDKINEEYDMLCKQQISNIKDRPRKSLLEHMIFNTIKNTIKDDKLKSLYLNEGILDMQRIVEENEVVYTFLEMLNTTKIEKINPEFLENFLG